MTPPEAGPPLVAAADRLAGWFGSPGWLAFWSAAIGERLALRPGARLVDLGSGAGVIARRLADDHALARVDCVDPFCAPLPGCAGPPLVHHARAAGAYARSMAPADAVLAKRMIHHVPAADRPALAADLARGLVPGGRLLVVTMPPTLGHPLFAAAHAHFAAHQVHHGAIEALLTGAGLRVTATRVAYPVAILWADYAAMIRARYLSTLAAFDDAALDRGLAELEATLGATGELRFDDVYHCVVGERPGGAGA